MIVNCKTIKRLHFCATLNIISKVLLTPSVLKVCLLRLYVPLRVSGSESVPCVDIVYVAQKFTA